MISYKYVISLILFILFGINPPNNQPLPANQCSITNDNNHTQTRLLYLQSIQLSRTDVYTIILPLIEEKVQQYNTSFNNYDSLSFVIATLFISESSNSKGRVCKSILWYKYNNPFGITGKDITLISWELINNEKIIKPITFKSFDSFDQSLDYLFINILITERYNLFRTSQTVHEYFINLQKCGYMSNDKWYITAELILNKYINGK